uniref:DH domain-containing protein n=2 Tax=Kalmanozyma brasiliensis (strain GHG001) TaxID=1365824 RepID=V5ELV6_KALBG
MLSSTISEEQIDAALGSNLARTVDDEDEYPLVTPKMQLQDSSDGSGLETAATQSDISRTPSTSTTGSSHAGSLDTAISSVPSGTDFEDHYKSQADELSADTLRVDIGDYNSNAHPSQASPVSLISEVDGALLEYPGLIENGTADPVAEAKYTTAKVRRYAALLELIDTERNYADDLATLVLVFFDNLCMMPFFNDQPARQALVMRNSEDLLRTHQKLSAKLEYILIDLGLRKPVHQRLVEDRRTDLEKALSPQADEAVVRVAKLFNQMMPSLQSYKAFCSRHGEALALIREAEKRHADWDAFEKHCADVLRMTRMAQKGSSRPPSGANTPNVSVNSPSSYFTPMTLANASTISNESTSTLTAGTHSSPASAAVTPGSGTNALRENSSRLLFRDFLIKPIQRLCLYPLVLQTLQKHSSATGDSVEELALAISLMREVADQVDEAGKRRESELRADLISSRIEPNQGVTSSFVKSLGDCQLSGTLDVLHHHRVLNPLVAPLRFKYFGVFIYHSFLLMVKVRKNSTYECRQWFPLWAARLSNVEDERNLIPNSFRLSVKDHHFELAASNAKERQLWIDLLSLAISRATFSPPGSEAAFPCSLFFGDAADGDMLEASEAPTPNASRPSEFEGYFDAAKSTTVDPLMEFLAMHAAGAAQASTSNQKTQRSSSGPWMPTEILLRHASPNSRAIVDRGMILSDSVISARIARDGGALSTLYAASGSGIGSAVGSSLGLNRLSAKETATVKIQRRKSCAGLLENADADEDPNNLVFTATFVQPGSRSRSSTRLQLDAQTDREGWKSSLLKKANRVRPASIFAPNGLSVNTELGSPTWGPGSTSTPTSPVANGRELPVHEFGSFGVVPLSPTGAGQSLTSSPTAVSESAGNSSTNLRASVTSLPPRSRNSFYGMKESLTMTFGRRSRTQSAQAGLGESFPTIDFGTNSALSSTCASPMASTADLPLDFALGSTSRRPSADGVYMMQHRTQSGGRSRTNSITSVTGSIRRVFTNASLATLKHKRTQSDVAKSLGGATQPERQMSMAELETPSTENVPVLAEAATIRRSGSNTLRRSRTMLNYSKNWFRGSAAANVVERVNAEAVAPVQSFQVQRQPSFRSIVTVPSTDVDFDSFKEVPKPHRASSTPVTRQTSVQPEGIRRASDTQLSTIAEQQRDGGFMATRRASKGFNPLKFLHNNRLSPLPSKNGL